MDEEKRHLIQQKRQHLAFLRWERDNKYRKFQEGHIKDSEKAKKNAQKENRRYYQLWIFRAIAQDPIDAVELREFLEERGFKVKIDRENEDGELHISIEKKLEIVEYTQELYFQTCGELWYYCGEHFCSLEGCGIAFGGNIKED